MDKEKTGRLIAQARKERGLTQQQLAERMHITAKAVSKWETGVSCPDVGLLIPLSEELGLSVTELLEGRRMAVPEDRTPEQVEDIVKSALSYSGQSPEEKKRRRRLGLVYAGCAAIALLELGTVWLLGLPLGADAGWGNGPLGTLLGSFGTGEILCLLFGAYLMLGAPERLPRYYDENRISGLAFGAFRMNTPGLTYNNRNWPHILRALRIFCLLGSVLCIPLGAAAYAFLPEAWLLFIPYVYLALYLGGLFVPVYVLGRKYE